MENITKLPLDSKLLSEKTDFNMPFKLQEMIDAFRNRKGTAPGPDKFSSFFLSIYPTQPLTFSWSFLI